MPELQAPMSESSVPFGYRFLQCGGGFAGPAPMTRMGIVTRGCPVDSGVLNKRVHRNSITAAPALQVAMDINKLRRVVIVARVLGEFRATHADFDVLTNLQMQMRVV